MNDNYSDISYQNVKELYNYVEVDIFNFDVSKITVDKDKDSNGKFNNKYIIKYNNGYLKLLPEKKFRSYGFKNVNINNVNDFNLFKVSIIFDNNRFHDKYKNVIDTLYNKLYLAFKERSIEVIHPLGIKKYSLDLEINKESIFHEYKNLETSNLSIKRIRDMEGVHFQIAPVIILKKLSLRETKNGKKLFINFTIKEAYIEYCKPSYPNDLICHWMQDIQVTESEFNNEENIIISDNESDDKII